MTKIPSTEIASIKKAALPSFFQFASSIGFVDLAEMKYETEAIIDATKERITNKWPIWPGSRCSPI
jgi:hypothetical protein